MKLHWWIIILVAGLLIAVILLAMTRRPRKNRVYVIGENFAKASEAEEQRKQKGNTGISPMPDAEYDFWRGETSLINPVKNSLDSELSGLGQSFATSDAHVRAGLRSSISLDEFYTLLSFSRRAAVFALRERSVDWVQKGLTAITMIEAERTDFRDILGALSLLYHSASRIGADADQLFRDAARLSAPNVAELLIEFIERPLKEKDIRASWGYDEVETKDGVGIIGRGFADYRPTYDLKKIVLEIADVVAKDKYQPSSVEVASELDPFWLRSEENRAAAETLKQVRAGASISAALRPNEHPGYKGQTLMIFLVEVPGERDAQDLLEMSRKKKPSDYSMIGVAKERLFCLVIGRSIEHGVESFETTASVSRFSDPISEVLGRNSKKQ
jgi:hypothetical protein